MNPKTVAIVGPAKLADSFAILLDSVPGMRLLTYSSDFDTLLSSVEEDSPDFVLSFIGSIAREGWLYYEQAGQIKSLWPRTFLIALVTDSQIREVMRDLGASAVFFEGVSPNRLLQAMAELDLNKEEKIYLD